MQVILLATGEANPLRPITDILPSPMLPLANRPVMLYVVEMLARQGFKHIIVSLHTLAGEIEAYFGSGRRWGVHLHYLLQRDALGTAGALRWAKSSLTKPFLVLPADALIDLDIAQAIDHHKSRRPRATVIVHRSVEDDYGRQIWFSPEGWVSTASIDMGQLFRYGNDTGALIFEPEVLDLIPPRIPYDIHRQLIPTLLEAGHPVSAYPMSGYWNPLNSFHKYHEAQRTYLYSAWGNPAFLNETPALRFPVIEGHQISPGIWVGRNQVIHPSAQLAPPVYIGQDCQIGENAELGPETVIGDHVMVDQGASISQSTVLSHTYIGQLVNIENRLIVKDLLIDVATAQNMRVVDPLLLAPIPPAIVARSLNRLANQAAGLCLFLLTFPLFLTLSLLVWLSTAGVFDLSPRLRSQLNRSPGEAREFMLIRFRTRRSGKLTRIGRWLEKWEGQCLPELLNVVRGEMDLVGVMPLPPDEEERLVAPWQQKKKDGNPGLTGLWYIRTDGDSELDEIVIADIYYLATRSLMKDIRLLLQTPKAWFRRLRKTKVQADHSAEFSFLEGEMG